MRPWLTLAVVLALSACSGSSSPTSPTQPPNYQGRWSGTWTSQGCVESGNAVGIGCSAFFGSLAGRPGTLVLTLSQTGTSIQGTLMLGGNQINVTGFVGDDGAMVISGQGPITGGTLVVSGWRSTANGSVMTGNFTFAITLPDFSGIRVAATLQLTRTA